MNESANQTPQPPITPAHQALLATARTNAAAKQFAQAEALLNQLLSDAPRFAAAWATLAAVCAPQQKWAQGQAAALRACALEPLNADVLMLCATLHLQTKNLDIAATYLQRTVAARPAFFQAHNQLGTVLLEIGGAVDAAQRHFEMALAIEPRYVLAQLNLGILHRKNGRPLLAKQHLEAVLQRESNAVAALFNLGAVEITLGDGAAALRHLNAAVLLNENLAEAHGLIGQIHRQNGQLDRAKTAYLRASSTDCLSVNYRLDAGDVLVELGETAAAQAQFAQAIVLQPNSLAAHLRRLLQVPACVDSQADIAAARARFAQGLTRLEAQTALFATLPTAQLCDALYWSFFYLAYQGEDDRALMQRYGAFSASLLQGAMPQFFQPMPKRAAAATSRIKVGFISRQFYQAPVGLYFGSWITDLDRSRFDVTVYYTNDFSDAVSAKIGASADKFVQASPPLAQIAASIRDDDLDILLYPELGMDPKLFALAAMRLAPTQCMAWGHPVTSGHANIDYFISCTDMEPDAAQAHYREALLRLPGIGTNYAAPLLADASIRLKTRLDYGLPADRVCALYPQSLFKIHPDNDAVLARVLRENPNLHVVMFAGRSAHQQEVVLGRIARALLVEGQQFTVRITVLPNQGIDDYRRVNQLCDFMVDTLHWSGGNTSLDALGMGLPIVTLPGRFMRGRQTMGMLKQLAMTELIAKDVADYAAICSRLCADAPWRDALRARLATQSALLFANPAPIHALAQHFEAMVRCN